MYENDKIFGVDLVTAYDLELNKKYNLVKDNTDYLKYTPLEEVKDIKFSIFLDVIILKTNGDVFINGKKIIKNNIKYLHFVDAIYIFAIDNENRIFSLTIEDEATKLLNNRDYRYKKIILTPLEIVALTNENTIKCFGNLIDTCIDYTRFSEVDNIGYIEENNDIVVIKNKNVYSLFGKYSYSNFKNDITIYGETEENILIVGNFEEKDLGRYEEKENNS